MFGDVLPMEVIDFHGVLSPSISYPTFVTHSRGVSEDQPLRH